MLILASLVIALLAGLFIATFNHKGIGYEIAGGLTACIAGSALLLVLLVLPLNHLISYPGDIVEFNTTKAFVAELREKGDDIERTAAMLDIIEQNRWLASSKYWNSTLLDIWIPDTIEELTPIPVD